MAKAKAKPSTKPTAKSTAKKPATTRRVFKVNPKRAVKVAGRLHVSPGLVETIVHDYLNGER